MDVAAGAAYMLPKQRPLNTLEDPILRTIEERAVFEQDCPHPTVCLEDPTQEGFASPWSLADDCCDFVENSGFMATAQDFSAPHPLSDGDKELVPFRLLPAAIGDLRPERHDCPADPDGMIDDGGDDDTPLPRTAVSSGHRKETCDQNDELVPVTTADPDGAIDGGGDDDTR
eukprot:s12704_g1.t1